MAQPPAFRERTEELERASLSTWATLALETKGRDRYEPEDPLRTVFQADRDRVLGCTAWVALAGKSALLPRRLGRTRLAETAAVVSVARTLAQALRLNEDLTEAVALAQALGATPFAEAGEEGIALATGIAYRPEEQALRVVERLAADAGLNLTWETRDGILQQRWDGPAPATLEADAARFARRIVEVCALAEAADALGAPDPAGLLASLGTSAPEVAQRLAADVAAASWDRPQLTFGPRVHDVQQRAHDAARAALAGSGEAADASARAVHCVASLAVFALEGGVPASGSAASASTPVDRVAVVDDLAGSTDTALLARYRAAFEPSG